MGVPIGATGSRGAHDPARTGPGPTPCEVGSWTGPGFPEAPFPERTLLLVVKSVFEGAAKIAGDVAFEAASDIAVGFGLGVPFLEVGAGSGVVPLALDHDDVLGRVEMTIATPVQPLSGGEFGRHGDRCDPGEHRERGFAADSTGV